MRRHLLALSLTSLLASTIWLPVFADSFNPAPSQTQLTQEPTLEQEFSIKAAITDHPRQVIKNGKYFAILSETGALPPSSPYGNGLYKDDTRYLSCWDISLNGQDTVLLLGDCQKGYAGTFNYANIPLPRIKFHQIRITSGHSVDETVLVAYNMPVLIFYRLNKARLWLLFFVLF